jgi:hypothetical protein
LVRDDDARPEFIVGDGSAALLGSVISQVENETGDVGKEGLVFTAQAEFFEEAKAASTRNKATKSEVVGGGDLVEVKKNEIDGEIVEWSVWVDVELCVEKNDSEKGKEERRGKLLKKFQGNSLRSVCWHKATTTGSKEHKQTKEAKEGIQWGQESTGRKARGGQGN